MKKIDGRHRAFIEYYAATHRARESAIAAGYSAKGAAARASELLKDEDILRLVKTRQKELCEALGITKDTIVREAWETYQQCREGTPRLVWDAERREKVPDGTWSFNASGSIQALKLLGELTGALEQTENDGKTEINILMPPGAGGEILK